MTDAVRQDPITVLRAYRELAPWNLRDLAAVVGAVLSASAITPINAAARATPSERTIRFYVTRGLVSPPDGRGTAAAYTYRHFLQVLHIKLRQMEGVTLSNLVTEMQELTGDVLERRAAAALGSALPPPDRLALRGVEDLPRGRSGRALSAWLARDIDVPPDDPTTWHRIPVSRGVELHLESDHPLARLGPDDRSLAGAVRQAIAKLTPETPD